MKEKSKSCLHTKSTYWHYNSLFWCL